MMQLYELSANGIWKIEAQNLFKGGDIKWDESYYIRHLISGKYLAIDDNDKLKSKLVLTREKSLDSLWNFVKIDNLTDNMGNTEKIRYDSFFRLMN